MSENPRSEILNGETRLIFTHARTGQVIHQSWAEIAFTAVPRDGERVSLALSEGTRNEETGQWEIQKNDSLVLLVKDVEYSYNYVRFHDADDGIDAQRLLTDIWIRGEPLGEVEEPD